MSAEIQPGVGPGCVLQARSSEVERLVYTQCHAGLQNSPCLMNKYERAIAAFERGETHTMRVFGNSMQPVIRTKSKLTFASTDDYQVGDVVMCKVKGRMIDAHWITKKDSQGRFMIANNHNHENGWASQIVARVVAINGEAFGRAQVPQS